MPTYVDPTTAIAALSQTPLAQQPQANFAYQGGDLPVGVSHDQISNWLRGMNYSQGLSKLKEKMVPAILGHDYVPPTAHFNDTETPQQFNRDWETLHPSYDYLKLLEAQMNDRLMQNNWTKSDNSPVDFGYRGNAI